MSSAPSTSPSERGLADLTLALVGIPSVTGDEEVLGDEVARSCLRAGASVQRYGTCVVATRPGEPGAARIGLFGHLDTVTPAEDQPCEIAGDRIYGCGSCDMKGGLAVMLALLGRAHRATLVAVFYDREEGPYQENGLRRLLAAGVLPPLDVALALEPTGNAIQSGCLGGLHAQVTFSGRRAHSARPWQGENAIYKASRYLERLAAFEPREVVSAGLGFREVMTATMANTDNSRNVVPDRFTLNVNYRFGPGKAAETARAELEALVAGEASVSIVDECPAGKASHDHPLVRAWRERHDLAVEPKQAWTDVAQLTEAGIDAINFGPGDPAQAHQAAEYVSVAALARSCELLADLLS